MRAWMALALATVLAGCATKGDIRDLRIEIMRLAERQDSVLAELRMETISTQDTLRTQSNQLFDFRGDITRQLREIGESLGRLEALAGANQRGLVQVRDQIANMRRTDPGPPRDVVSDSTAVSGQVGPGGGNAEQYYRTATDQYGRGSLNTARMAFQQFLDMAPNHELAPHAHFYLADILYQQENLDGALQGFRQVQARFPESDRVPEALYRIALIQIDRDEIEAAIQTLERVINTYPETTIAELAAERLAEIR